MKSLIGIIN